MFVKYLNFFHIYSVSSNKKLKSEFGKNSIGFSFLLNKRPLNDPNNVTVLFSIKRDVPSRNPNTGVEFN